MNDEGIEIEQMVRFLLARENHFTLSQFNGGVDVFSACQFAKGKEHLRHLGRGPTLREALAAACVEVRRRAMAP